MIAGVPVKELESKVVALVLTAKVAEPPRVKEVVSTSVIDRSSASSVSNKGSGVSLSIEGASVTSQGNRAGVSSIVNVSCARGVGSYGSSDCYQL